MASDNTALILAVVGGGAFYLWRSSQAQAAALAPSSGDGGGGASTTPAPAPAPASPSYAPPPQGGTYFQDPGYAPPPNVPFTIPYGAQPWTSWPGASSGTPKPWHVSTSERAAIKAAEGLKLTRYRDGAGYSIGYGHQIAPGDGIGTTITATKAAQLFAADMASVESTLNRLVTVALTQNEIDALGDFVFNVGAGAFGRSTLLRLLNAGDYAGAARQLAQFAYSAGQNVPALVARRAQEAALFSQGGVV